MSLYTKTEAANHFKVSVSSIDRMVKRGDITPTKIGSCIRFSQDSIDCCIRRLTVSKIPEFIPDPKEVISAELARMGRKLT